MWQQLLPLQHFIDFEVLKFVGVSQPKPMHGFLPNFQDILTPRGSRGDYNLGVSGNNCCHDNALNILSGNTCCHGNVLNTFQSYTSYLKKVAIKRIQLYFISHWPRPGLGYYETPSVGTWMCAFVTFLHQPLYLIRL